LGLAVASNRAEESKQSTGRSQKGQLRSAKEKSRPRRRGSKKPVKDLKFEAYEGEAEDEDESMIELIQGTLKHAAKEAKEAAKKQLQTARSEAERVTKTTKQSSKKKSTNVDGEEDNSEYVLIKSRKAKSDKDQAAATASTSNTDSASDVEPTTGSASTSISANIGKEARVRKPRKTDQQAAFFKTDIPPPRKPGDRPPRGERREQERRPRDENATGDAANPNSANYDAANNASGDERRPRRNRPPRQEGENADPNVPHDGEALPQRPPREPREPRKPRELQQIPAPLSVGSTDGPSLDDMLGAISNFYGTTVRKNFFSGMERETLIKIITEYLTIHDIYTLSQVNHFLSKFTRDQTVWKTLCIRDFNLNFSKRSLDKKFKPIYRDEFEKLHGKRPSRDTDRKNGRPAKDNQAASNANHVAEEVAANHVAHAPVAVAEEDPAGTAASVTKTKPEREPRKPREKKPKDV